MRLYRPHILLEWFILGILCAVGLSACVDPLDTGDEVTETISHDEWVRTDTKFIAGRTDSVYASVGERTVAFGSMVTRPNYHNGCIDGGYYITIQATHDIGNNTYESMSLRLDDIRDTGVYKIYGLFTAPKDGIDTTAPAYYGATYERRIEGSTESYEARNLQGEIHILSIDREIGLIIGTFWFSAYDTVSNTTITVSKGTFRIRIK